MMYLYRFDNRNKQNLCLRNREIVQRKSTPRCRTDTNQGYLEKVGQCAQEAHEAQEATICVKNADIVQVVSFETPLPGE